MDIVAFDFRKFSHDGDVLYDGMRVDVEGPGLQSAMPFRRATPSARASHRMRPHRDERVDAAQRLVRNNDERSSIPEAAGCVAAPPGL
jgi:hypothetical protein